MDFSLCICSHFVSWPDDDPSLGSKLVAV